MMTGREREPRNTGGNPAPALRHALWRNRSGCQYKHFRTAVLLGILHNTDTQEPKPTLPKAANLWEQLCH